MYDSSFCNLKKEIPFFKLLLDIGSLYMRCHLQLNVTETDIFCHILMDDFRKKSTFLLQNFIRIESVSEDLFCTGDIETLDYCMAVYRQFINNETLDFFIEQSDEIKSALHKLRDELDKFAHYLNDLLTTLFFFLPQKYRRDLFGANKYQGTLDKIKQTFIMDLKNQFKKFIKTDGKYSSGIYGKKGLFLEKNKYTYIFDGGHFFKIVNV